MSTGFGGQVGRPFPPAPAPSPAAFVTRPVHVSILYQLRGPAVSLTRLTAAGAAAAAPQVAWHDNGGERHSREARHTFSDSRAINTTANNSLRRRGDRDAAVSFVAPTSDSRHSHHLHHLHNDSQHSRRIRGAQTEGRQPPPQSTPPHPPPSADGLPLSTFDLRELSKVVLRDAVYSRVMDVAPYRAGVHCGVWQLGPGLIQLDVAVAVVAVGVDGASGRKRSANKQPHYSRELPPHMLAAAPAIDGAAVWRRAGIVDRLATAACERTFAAAVLRPHLGDAGCRGSVVSVVLDGVELLC